VCLKGDCSLGKGQKWTLLEAPGSFIGIPILPMKIDQLLSKLINLRARNPERKITYLTYFEIIGKYLSRLRQFDQVIALQERFEAQLQASRLAITFGMRALGMTGQIRDGRFQRVIESCDVPGLQGLDNPA